MSLTFRPGVSLGMSRRLTPPNPAAPVRTAVVKKSALTSEFAARSEQNLYDLEAEELNLNGE